MSDESHETTERKFYNWTEENLLEACKLKTPSLRREDLTVNWISKDKLLEGQPTIAKDSGSNEQQKVAIWKCCKSLESAQFEIFNDPIHGSIELHPLLVSIVNTPEFYRLKNIKQLGGVYNVFHGATHTRFEHSLGTCFIAGEYMRRLQRKQPELDITDKEILQVEIAALCQDLGHGPLSYVFNNELKPRFESDEENPIVMPKRAKLSSQIFEHHIYHKLNTEFLSYGIQVDDCEFIVELMDHDSKNEALMSKERWFLYEIVANIDTGIDAVKWDYFARDCHHLGIANEFDWRRLMKLSRVIYVNKKLRICYRDKEVNNIWRMFCTRYNLHHRVYKHSTVLAVEHRIAEAIFMVKDDKLLAVHVSGRKERISIAEALKMATANPPDPDLSGFLALTDSIIPLILNEIPNSETSPLYKAQEMLKKLERREILHLVAVDTHPEHQTEDTQSSPSRDSTDAELHDVVTKEVSISYDSEKRSQTSADSCWNKDNPLNYVYFYKKETPWMAEPGRELFAIEGQVAERSLSPTARRLPPVLPKTFKTKEIRIYGPNKNKRKAVQEAYSSKAKRPRTE